MTPMQIKKAVAGYENLPVFWTPNGATESFPVMAAIEFNSETCISGENSTMCKLSIWPAMYYDKAISFRDLYFCCEGAKRLPVYVQDLNGDLVQVTKVNIEKENGWIELCDKVSEFQQAAFSAVSHRSVSVTQVLTAENDEPEYDDVNEWLEDRAMHGGIR